MNTAQKASNTKRNASYNTVRDLKNRPEKSTGSLNSTKINSVLAGPKLRRLVTGFAQRRPGFEPGLGHVGFVVDKVALEQVFSEPFSFPCQFAFHRLLHNHHHHLSSGAGTVGQTVAAVPSGLSFTPRERKSVLLCMLLANR
jgi:hypothetical protein